jgi:hypothetical protein
MSSSTGCVPKRTPSSETETAGTDEDTAGGGLVEKNSERAVVQRPAPDGLIRPQGENLHFSCGKEILEISVLQNRGTRPVGIMVRNPFTDQ